MLNKISNSKIFLRLNVLLKKVDAVFLPVIFGLFSTYSFYLAYKRYQNFEYGKFDLGNMSQIVWNTLHGRFYEVTDQFGSNISRIGMSHFDPILLLFVPVFAVSSHPMILVFAQHLSIFSAIFPIYFLAKKFTHSRFISVVSVFIYLLYPANGFLVVWTEFHGISFVAPLFIWFIYFLERVEYLKTPNRKNIAVYLVLLILLLSGKEEIGAMLAMFSVFLFFKNKKLALVNFVVTMLWFLISFFVIIPHYGSQRDASVESFLSSINKSNPKPQDVQADNFFFNRYSYLGKNYPQMISTVFTRPEILEENLNFKAIRETNQFLLGPFLFTSILTPFTYFGLPDFAIGILSSDEIYTISNHRISFIVVLLFVGYLFHLKFLAKNQKTYLLLYVLVIGMFLSSLFFTIKSKNPLYSSFLSRLKVYEVFAQETLKNEDKMLEISQVEEVSQTENSLACLNYVWNYIEKENPQKYSGPDYLGAHTSLRPVNAVFPSAAITSDIFVADFLEDKVYEPLNTSESWTENKNVLKKILDTNQFKGVFACDRMIVFKKISSTNIESSVVIDPSELKENIPFSIKMGKKEIFFALIKKASSEDMTVQYAIRRAHKTDTLDKLAFWRFENENGKKYEFVDYRPFVLNIDLNDVSNEKFLKITGDFSFVKQFIDGNVKVYFGFGNGLDTSEIYLGQWDLSK